MALIRKRPTAGQSPSDIVIIMAQAHLWQLHYFLRCRLGRGSHRLSLPGTFRGQSFHVACIKERIIIIIIIIWTVAISQSYRELLLRQLQ
jgi:hypothetical protein